MKSTVVVFQSPFVIIDQSWWRLVDGTPTYINWPL